MNLQIQANPIQVDSVTPSNNPILGFLFLFEVPYDFSDGILTIKAKYAFTNPNNEKLNYVEVSHNADVELAPLSKKKAPIGKVKGSWKWGNGPGVPYFTTHSRPEARYSYDLVVLKKGVTHYSHSDISDNKSFFCFDRPIVCMQEGEVIEVKDDVPDNNGLTAHPMGPNSVIVVHHGSAKRKMNRYSKYYHIKYNSAKVKKGDFVSPDQILAKVRNSGYSSEPHLHIGYFMIDSTGRLRALPMTFKNLYLHPIDDYPFWSQKVSGVPTGDRKYFVS